MHKHYKMLTSVEVGRMRAKSGGVAMKDIAELDFIQNELEKLESRD